MLFPDEIEVAPGADRDELVGIVDAEGHVIDAALRSRVRSDNLRHGGTAVLVRNGAGQIYVHQRSPEKDWRPAHFDAASGGMLRLGEDPLESAIREIGEELGITGVELTELGVSLFEDATTRVFEWVYEVIWEGPMEFRDQEVVAGQWMTLDELRVKLTDPKWPFVPDTRHLLGVLSDRGVGDY